MRSSFRAFLLMIICMSSICLLFMLAPATATDPGIAQPPAQVNLDTLVNQYGPVVFNHEMHTYIAEGCGDCHHVHNTAQSQSCRSCHALESSAFKDAVVTSFMACRMCHGEYNPDSPSMPGLKVAYHKNCFGCHVGIGQLGQSPKACTEKCHTGGTASPGEQ